VDNREFLKGGPGCIAGERMGKVVGLQIIGYTGRGEVITGFCSSRRRQ
jgi:hypothetical protein